MNYINLRVIIFFCFALGTSQILKAQKKHKNQVDTSVFIKTPFIDGKVVYESIYSLDSIINSERLFNSIKKVLLTNSNYKYTKIDEDRILGTITSEFSFNYVARPGIADVNFIGTSKMSIDVKNGKYRIRIYDNKSSWFVLNVYNEFTIEEEYRAELNRLRQGKWKLENSILNIWHQKLNSVIDGFANQVNKQLSDDF